MDRDNLQRAAVSIVVPTHNRPEMLQRLLDSLRQLTYLKTDLELIVVGTEHDPGRAPVDAFTAEAGFPVIYHVVPSSQSHSASFKRNEGARVAKGDILAFTDDDCIVHPDWVTAAVPFFDDPEVGGVEGCLEIPRPDKPTLTYKGSRRLSLPGGYQTCNMLFRKSVFVECGGFDLTFPYYLEDTDLAYTVMERGYKIRYAKDAVVMHPVQPGRPLKLITVARTVERVPYLLAKHPSSRAKLKRFLRPFNRSHYLYLMLYGGTLVMGVFEPIWGITLFIIGLGVLLPLHLARDFWGLHFTRKEFTQTALCYPIVPILRLFYWLKGLVRVRAHLKSRGLTPATRANA